MDANISTLSANFAILFQQHKTCSWCGHHGVDGDGNGIFMDIDAFPGRGFSYSAIPICGGCGGLGRQYKTTDFKARTAKICDLRFKFYPTDRCPEPPSIVPYKYLRELLKEVEDLVARYKITSDCYATRLIRPESHARKTLKLLKELVQADLQVLSENNSDLPTTHSEANREAMIAIYSGEFKKGLQLFQALLEKYPQDSTLWHDMGILHMTIDRDIEKAQSCLEKAVTLEPKKTLHFYQLGNLYLQAKNGNYLKAIHAFENAKKQLDWAEFQVANSVDFDEIIDSLTRIYD